MFSSLHIHNYRLYAAGGLVSNTGTWMGRVAQDWLILTELTDHSATALGIATGLQFAPFLVLAPWAGALADRFPKRRIMLTTQSTLMATATLLAWLTVTGRVQLWQVFALALVQGLAQAVDNPARQTFVGEMVGSDHLTNAVGLNSASFHAGRLIGPGVAGLLIAAYGTGVAMGANAASFAVLLLALAAMRTGELHPAPLARGKGQIRAGVAYVRGRPDIQLVMALVFVLGTFGLNFQLTIALMATRAFGKGPTEFGLLGSVMAVGSLAAALLSARRARPRLRVLLVALGGFTAASAAAALAPTYAAFAVALVPCGLAALTALTTANAYVQLAVDPVMRGRVMALYMAIFLGGTPIGAPLIGRLGDWAGPRWSIGIGSVAVGLALALALAWLAKRENVRVSCRPGERPALQVRRTLSAGEAEPAPEVPR